MQRQGEKRKKSEKQMGFEPTTLRVLFPTLGHPFYSYTSSMDPDFLHFTHNTELPLLASHRYHMDLPYRYFTFCPTHYHFCLPKVHVQPLALKCLLPFPELLPQSLRSIASLIKTNQSSAYNISLIKPFLTFSVTTSTTIAKTNGNNTASLVHTNFHLKLLGQLQIQSNSCSCLCTFIQTHHCSHHYLWYTFPHHCLLQYLPQDPVKCLLQVNKAHIQLLLVKVFLLQPPQNKHCIYHSFAWHKTKFFFRAGEQVRYFFM